LYSNILNLAVFDGLHLLISLTNWTLTGRIFVWAQLPITLT